MIKNYLLIALRSILKQRIYSAINIVGLSIGLASCIMIFMYVEDEYSYDKFLDNSENIYKVFLERSYPDHTTNYAVIPHSFRDVFVSDIPEVEASVRLINGGGNPIQVTYIDEANQRKSFPEENFMLADSNFFDIFSIKLLKGDPDKALSEPQAIVITEETALKYFGTENPIGKTIQSDFGEFRVSGISEDVPENSHFDFDFLGSIVSVPFFNNLNFTGFSAHTYLSLAPGTDPMIVQNKIPELVDTYAAPQIEQNLNTSYREYIEAGNGYNYQVKNIGDIHLDPQNYELALKTGGNKNDVYVFLSIAILILVIACINFMNLAIARSTERGKEVGIRKTLGSEKKQLVFQFLTESVIVAIFSLIISLGLVYLAMPYFNSMVQKNLELNLQNSMAIPALLLFSVFVGILAGSYPAFVLSSFSPIAVLKGVMKKGKSGSWLRNGLVVLQFTISIILILSTLIMRDQLDFIRNKDLGFDRENMLVLERAGVLGEGQEAFINEIRNIPGVVRAGGSNSIPVGQYFGIQFTQQGSSEAVTTNGFVINDGFIETMQFEIIEGKGFSKDQNDSLYIIINEATAKLMATDEIIGAKLTTQINQQQPVQLEVIGIVKNFHYMSLRDEISPFVLLNNEAFAPGVAATPFISIKVTGDYQKILGEIQSKWQTLAPEEPFKYTFLDSELDTLYTNEANSGTRISTFALLAIIIACIGLFGLSAYTAGLRTKEIGVRKVMGASVGKVVLLLSTDFTKLVLIAFLIAIPLGWYSMDKWLGGFTYRTDISLLNFLWAGLITFLIAWLTVSYQSFKAARINPVDSLKSE